MNKFFGNTDIPDNRLDSDVPVEEIRSFIIENLTSTKYCPFIFQRREKNKYIVPHHICLPKFKKKSKLKDKIPDIIEVDVEVEDAFTSTLDLTIKNIKNILHSSIAPQALGFNSAVTEVVDELKIILDVDKIDVSTAKLKTAYTDILTLTAIRKLASGSLPDKLLNEYLSGYIKHNFVRKEK